MGTVWRFPIIFGFYHTVSSILSPKRIFPQLWYPKHDRNLDMLFAPESLPFAGSSPQFFLMSLTDTVHSLSGFLRSSSFGHVLACYWSLNWQNGTIIWKIWMPCYVVIQKMLLYKPKLTMVPFVPCPFEAWISRGRNELSTVSLAHARGNDHESIGSPFSKETSKNFFSLFGGELCAYNIAWLH